jgi:hypothetical protein
MGGVVGEKERRAVEERVQRDEAAEQKRAQQAADAEKKRAQQAAAAEQKRAKKAADAAAAEQKRAQKAAEAAAAAEQKRAQKAAATKRKATVSGGAKRARRQETSEERVARLARQAAQRAADAEKLAGFPWQRRVPNGPLGRPDGGPKEMLLLAHLPERVRVWFEKYIEKLRKTEWAYKHVSLYIGRNGPEGDGYQVQVKIGKLVFLGRTWEPRLGALLAAAAILDKRLTFRLSLLAWILWIYEDDPEGSRFAAWSGSEEVQMGVKAAREGTSGGGAGPSNAGGWSFDMEEASEQELEVQPDSSMPHELPMNMNLPMPLVSDAQQEEAPQAVHAVTLVATLAAALGIGLSESLALLNQGAGAVADALMNKGMTQEQASKVLHSVGFDAGAALSSGLELNALVEAYTARELHAAGVGFDDLREVGAEGVDDLEIEEELDKLEERNG